jgi:hypothetical protein
MEIFSMKYSKSLPIYKLIYLALAIMLFSNSSLMAQETRGTIFGTVTDPTGAVVVGATVTVTSLATNISVTLTTNDSGAYEAPYLLPGDYSVSVTATGYKKAVQQQVTLPVNERIPADIKLEVGAVTEEVIVTSGDTSLLNADSPNASTSLTAQEISSLPVPYNNSFMLARSVPGMSVTANFNVDAMGPHSTAGSAGINTAGGVGGNEYSIDGVPNFGKDRRPGMLPFGDTVGEMKIETAFFDATKGRSTGANISIMTKSGTNDYHGSLSWQHWQQRWNATPLVNNRVYWGNIANAESLGNTAEANRLRQLERQDTGRSNNWTATIGGPIQFPRFGEGGPAIWNGKNKLFFFFSYNGMKENKTDRNNTRTVPTLKQRQGDFSELLALDPVRYQLYDPRTSTVSGGNVVRQTLPGNIVPILNPTYRYYMQFFPLPNTQGTAEGANNYVATHMPWAQDYKAYTNRIDWQINEKHKMFFKWSWNDYLEDRADWTYTTIPGLNSEALKRRNWGLTLDEVATINPTTYVNVAIAYNRFADGFASLPNKTLAPSSVGFPSYLDEIAGAQQHLPRLNFNAVSDFGLAYPEDNSYSTGSLRAELTKLIGNHTFRVGGDVRLNYRANNVPGSPAGIFTFDNTYVRRASNTSGTPNIGFDWAAFALGVPTEISIDRNTDQYLTNRSYAGYIQDDWRATPRLTLNLGLRYEYDTGFRERFNRGLLGYDVNAELPFSDLVEANYVRTRRPDMPATIDVRGGTTYLGVNGAPDTTFKSRGGLMPRLGVAYKLTEKTVIRAGYGLFYNTSSPLNDGIDQTGFSLPTNVSLTTIAGSSFIFNNTDLTTDPACRTNPSECTTIFSDPFYVRSDGTRLNTPAGSNLGLFAKFNSNYTFGNWDSGMSRQQRWRIGLQQELFQGIVAEAAYLGSYADNMGISKRLNPLPERYWTSGLVRNTANNNYLTGLVDNPFSGVNLTALTSIRNENPALYSFLNSNTLFSNTQIARQRLLRAFPQQGTLNGTVQDGENKYHHLELSIQKRLSKGFSFSASHTWAYSLERANYDNEFDAEPVWRINNDTRPHHFILSGIYELPFGKNKRFFSDNRLIGSVLGGWAISGIYQYQTGPALELGNWLFFGDLRDLKPSDGEKSQTNWFNWELIPAASRDYRASNPEPYRARIRRIVPANMLPAGTTYETVVPTDFVIDGTNTFHRRVIPQRLNWLRGDASTTLDMSLMRRFGITEKSRFEIKVDFINALNQVNWNNPTMTLTSTDFGRVTTPKNSPRLIQFQGRFQF